MPDSSSNRPWRSRTFDWPVDRLRIDVEVVEPRLLTALEWVILRVADEFPDATPTLSEVADELGLDRPEFLHDTLREVVRLRALAPRDPDVPIRDLGDVAFTDSGRALYRRGQIEADPATHAVLVDIDALTDEDLKAGERKPMASSPVLADPPPRQSIGLDRLRSVMRRFHADIVRDGRVRDVERVFRPVELAFTLGSDGTVDVDGPTLSLAARAVVGNFDPAVLALQERRTAPVTARLDFAAWRAQVTRVVPDESFTGEALAQIERARREVVLHASWLTLGDVRAALDAAFLRGVHVVVAARDAPHLVFSDQSGGPVLEIGAMAVGPLPCALIVDAATGLVIADVALRWRDEPLHGVVVGEVNGPFAVQHRRLLVDSVLDFLPDVAPGGFAAPSGLLYEWTVIAHLARLYLAPTPAHALAVKAAFGRRVTGLEGVEALHTLSTIGRKLAPGLAADSWDWRPAWDKVLRVLLVRDELPVEELHRLLKAAPPTVTASHFVDTAVDAYASGIGDRQRRTLRQIQAVAVRRWGRGITTTCPAWVRARDRNLAAVDLSGPTLRNLADDAADLLPPSEAAAWAIGVLARLNPQHGFVAWVTTAQALRPLVGTAWDNHSAAAWRVWLETAPPGVDAALSIALEVIALEAVAAPLLPRGASPAQVVALRRRVIAAWPAAAAAPYWATTLRSALPALGPAYRVTTHGPAVRALVADVADWPEGQATVTTWAAGIADAMRHADDLPALVYWLAELAGLAPALAGGLLPRARNAVHPHRQALRDARTRSLPLWSRISDAWRMLGLKQADLEALATTTHQQPSKKGGRKR